MSRVEYDAGAGRLDIWFNGTEQYSYYRVPAHIYSGLIASSSKGAYFNAHIRDQYG